MHMPAIDKELLLESVRVFVDSEFAGNENESVGYKVASALAVNSDARADSALLHRILLYAQGDTWDAICDLFDADSKELQLLMSKRDALQNRAGTAFISAVDPDDVIDMVGDALDAALSDMTFYETLVVFILESGYAKVSDFYNLMGIDHRYWHRYKKGFIPTKKRLLEMVFYLHLDEEDAEYLLNVAGYTLQCNNMTDVIVRFFLKNGYAKEMEPDQLLMLVDEVLLNFDQPPIHSEE